MTFILKARDVTHPVKKQVAVQHENSFPLVSRFLDA